MSDVILITPEELLTWLRHRREGAREAANQAQREHDPDGMNQMLERLNTYNEVIQHISFGGTP